MEAETEVEDSSIKVDMWLEDFQTLQEAFHGCQEVIEELKTSHSCCLEFLKEEMKAHLEQEMINVAEYSNKQNQTIDESEGQIKPMSSHLNYYKKKAKRDKLDQRPPYLPLNKAIVAAVNDLINSKQKLMLLSPKNKSAAVAKAVFHPNFQI